MRTGYKTTEFWVMLLTQLVNFGVQSGLIPVETQEALISMVASVGTLIAYIVARGIAKAGGTK